MAIKIFCNICNKFIRDAKQVEMKAITGSEICRDCEKALEFKMHDIAVIAQDSIKNIQKIGEDISKELLRIDRLVKSGAHQIDSAKQKATVEIQEAIKKVIDVEAKETTSDPQ